MEKILLYKTGVARTIVLAVANVVIYSENYIDGENMLLESNMCCYYTIQGDWLMHITVISLPIAKFIVLPANIINCKLDQYFFVLYN